MTSIDRKIDVIAVQFLLVQNRHQTHDWTLIGSGAKGHGILEWIVLYVFSKSMKIYLIWTSKDKINSKMYILPLLKKFLSIIKGE